jgi:hypothetical protein
MVGSMISIATAAPHQNHRLFRYRRAGVRSTPPTTPNTKKAIAYLAIMPKPMAAPKEFQCYAAEEGRHR